MIRDYKHQDKESVKNLYSDIKYLEPTFSKLDDAHYKKFVYDEQGIIGIVILEASYLTLNIFNIHVSKHTRGNRVGSKLIEYALQHCKDNKLHGLRVTTDSKNEAAQKFYLKNGFDQVGEVVNYDVEGQTAIFFYKSVRSNE